MLSLIYARTINFCIGDRGKIPWDLPDEFSNFNMLTDGKAIIMGRKTYEDHLCELPGRLNIVVSNQADFPVAANVQLVSRLEDALSIAQDHSDEYFVIGGVDLITRTIGCAQMVYETVIDTTITGDTMLPPLDYTHWSTQILSHHSVDHRHKFAFTVYLHNRITR